MSLVAARIVPDFDFHNAVNVRTVDVYIQDSAGAPGDKRGVEGLQYEVLSNDQVIQTGLTDKEGKIQVFLFPEATTILKVLGTEYEVSLLGTLYPRTQLRGVQQRLDLLGYHPGTLHADAALAADYDNKTEGTEKAILDFQADNKLFPDAMFGPKSQQALEKLMTKTKAE